MPVPSPFRPGYKAYTTGSHSGWGGSPAPNNPNRGQGAWGSPPPPGNTDRDTLSRAGHTSGGGASQERGISAGHPHNSQGLGEVLPSGGGGECGTSGAGGGGGSGPGGGGSSNSPGMMARGSPNADPPRNYLICSRGIDIGRNAGCRSRHYRSSRGKISSR